MPLMTHRKWSEAAPFLHRGFAEVGVEPPPALLSPGAPVFTMGSCFARGLEEALVASGRPVVSTDPALRDEPALRCGHTERPRLGFFNRYTPASMLQEFRRCFDELSGWEDDTLLVHIARDRWHDVHYAPLHGLDASRDASLARRAWGRRLVRRAATAEVIVLTLGMTEGWVHEPTGLHCNRVSPKLLLKSQDYTLHVADYGETIGTLEAIHGLLTRHHETGRFTLVVTVSPIPMEATFTRDDVVVANAASKATLRAAVAAFCKRRERVRYFPSYEIVTNSDPAASWKPDRLHVTPEMVEHVVGTFSAAYYGQEEQLAA
jgi:hypothetical protein